MSPETKIPLKIMSARAFHFRAPLEKPYRTTFGVMTHRQAVVIALENEDGTTGTGESWINFPLWAPYERMAAFAQGYFPGILGKNITDIPAFVRELWKKQYRAALQSATLGPAVQALCAVEAALWDIQARLRDIPLAAVFAEKPSEEVTLYGSGINPPFLGDSLREARKAGIRTFKLKLGYGDAEDRENIRNLKKILGPDARLAVDVNRSWTYTKAREWLPCLRDEGIAWLEEPLAIEEQHRYGELYPLAGIPVSAGENFLIPPGANLDREGEEGLSLNQSGLALHMVQPAIVKNCCFSDALRLRDTVEAQGKKLCPHFLGSAPGLAATAHLASLTRARYLEVDINPNPLRTSLFREPYQVRDGMFRMSGAPGLGWTLRADIPDSWVVSSIHLTA
jgi:L-alanine-DL-glutamate epimerase-like enolase superfamily enzyme